MIILVITYMRIITRAIDRYSNYLPYALQRSQIYIK